MRLRLALGSVAVTIACLAPSSFANAQGNGYQRWKQFSPSPYLRWSAYSRVKKLPPGFHDFLPLERLPSEMSEDIGALCENWTKAISLGKRIGEGLSAADAVDEIADENGRVVCGFVRGLQLVALRAAIRGDDQGRPIYIVEFQDQAQRLHYAGGPLRWGPYED